MIKRFRSAHLIGLQLVFSCLIRPGLSIVIQFCWRMVAGCLVLSEVTGQNSKRGQYKSDGLPTLNDIDAIDRYVLRNVARDLLQLLDA